MSMKCYGQLTYLSLIKLSLSIYARLAGEDYVEVLAMPLYLHFTFEPESDSAAAQPAGRRKRSFPSPAVMTYSANLTFVADSLVEHDEYFTATLSVDDDSVTFVDQNATIFIINNDCKECSGLSFITCPSS